MRLRRTFAAVFAVLLVTGTIGGAADLATSDDGLDLGLDGALDALQNPIGQAQAVACGGACIAIGGAAAGAIVGGGIGVGIGLWSADKDIAKKEETIQRKIDFYQMAWQQKANVKSVDAIASNGVRTSDPKVRMEAIGALKKAANQGDSLTEAKDRVSAVVNNRTAVKQNNLLTAWSASALTVKYIENVTDNSSNIGDTFAKPTISYSGGFSSDDPYARIASGYQDWNKTVQLSNGTSVTVTAIPVKIHEDLNLDGSSDTNNDEELIWVYPSNTNWQSQTYTWDETDTSLSETSTRDITITFEDYRVKRNQSSEADTSLSRTGDVRFINISKWRNLYNQQQNQNNEIIQSVHQIADSKYAGIKAGDVKLPTANPYYVAEQNAPTGQESAAFIADWLASIGASNPQDWGNVSSTKITLANGSTYYGQLLGSGLPENWTVSEGDTINSSNITGNPYMITQQGKIPLDGEWTLDNVEGLNSNKSSLTFENKNLNTTSLDGYRDAVQWMLDQQAESEAREKEKESSTPIVGGLLGGLDLLPGIPSIAELALLIFLSLLAIRVVGS